MNENSPSAGSVGGLQEPGSVLLLAAEAFLGMISTLVLGVVLELVVLLPAFVFQILALSSVFLVTSPSASVTCLHRSNTHFLCIDTRTHLCEQQYRLANADTKIARQGHWLFQCLVVECGVEYIRFKQEKPGSVGDWRPSYTKALKLWSMTGHLKSCNGWLSA